jgi:phenylalanyl-tRNA synthetase alpha chain
MQRFIKIKLAEEKEVISKLNKRNDPEGARLRRFLEMPDLSRKPGSPLAELVNRIVNLERFKDFEILDVPEIVNYEISFDLFNFPAEHPARSKSDTYFLDDNHILRTHTTVMWYYHLNLPEIREKIKKGESFGALSYGKVYRKDEIDRNHMNVFHQMDGWYLCRKDQHIITLQDLQNVLVDVAKAVFGENVKYRFNSDQFPYTDPSLEMELFIPSSEVNNTTDETVLNHKENSKKDENSFQGRWIEVLGAGVVRGVVLRNLGVDPDEYNGWAFGFGLERLAIISMDLPDIRLLWSDDERVKKQLKLGTKYKEVSKYPPVIRDISFVVKKDFVPNNYFDLIRDLGGDLVEQVELIDKYEDSKKFGSDKVSYTYRIVYRSMERTLKSEEIDEIQNRIYKQTAEQFQAELR